MDKIYLDNAATTRVRDEVLEVLAASLRENYGNPSSTHSFGRSARTLIEKARKTIAGYLNASPSEIIFTSGGTEADNMILRSAVRDLGVKTIITSKTEHHAVLHTVEQLENEYGITVKYVVPDPDGTPNNEHLEWLLQGDGTKKLVSLMHVNNEIGNKINMDEVARICKDNNALLHSDAVQSIGHWEWDTQKTGVDFLAAAAHKFHGPKGVGFAYIRKKSGLHPLIFGGEQERGYRAGTESVHNIVGMEEAVIRAYEELEKERNYIKGLKTYFVEQLREKIPGVEFNGNSASDTGSTYTLVNVRLPFSKDKAQMLLFHLDLKGIACSEGSACQSGSLAGSHVLNAILSEEELRKPSLRFSFSGYNTKEELDYVVNTLKDFGES
ncbi:cysteine desulfurase family protein [Sinomicrobium weinanense]|uniref:cysteine desulfurase n=1 Tax=Sinomicrobium weinanense TaxID=2842200 RepID=A0A926Q322_9FLAO|nr:cysteine desulfurase family protein [Sinomicrobium weinanense]MBC9795295.1 cysteine desulfurase [Sinomicrobium weinanense]MBU3125767.1 cysteine desulfurase [Sinomicrobium weinanense]